MSAYQTCPAMGDELAVSEAEASSEDVLALEQIWERLDAEIRQSQFNLLRLVEQKIRVQDRIADLRK